MAEEYSFIGEKGARKAVRTVDVSDECYEMLKMLKESGGTTEQKWTYSNGIQMANEMQRIFGGNCYGMVVHLAMDLMLATLLDELEEQGSLKGTAEECYEQVRDVLMHILSSTYNEESEIASLHAFEKDTDMVLGAVRKILKGSSYKVFKKNIELMQKVDNRPAGELAFLALWNLVSFGNEKDSMVFGRVDIAN